MAVPVSSSTQERDALEGRYEHLLTERLDWGKLVNYGSNRNEPVFGWFRYKEAFSRRLVEEILLNEWRLPPNARIFDPFAGCGTTLLASHQLGYHAYGCDIMPIAVFVTRVKLACSRYKVQELERAVAKLLDRPPRPSKSQWPDVGIIGLAFTKKAREDILAYRDAIRRQRDGLVRDFLMLGLLTSLEEASFTSKDGQFLRIVERRPRAIREALERNFARMLGDLRVMRMIHRGNGTAPKSARIALGDARALPRSIARVRGKISGTVTSPPYLNRYDYSRTSRISATVFSGRTLSQGQRPLILCNSQRSRRS